MSRRVVVRVPGVSRASGALVNEWFAASLELDASRARRLERGGELRVLDLNDEHDLLLAGVRATCAAAGIGVPDTLRVRAVSSIPIAAGHGASTAAVLAGVLGARAMFDLQLSDDRLARIAEAIDPSPSQTRVSLAAHVIRVDTVCDDRMPAAAHVVSAAR
ncbi:MAG TPA: hypothetical protein VHB25_20680 [Gemmatimonadaceae bacterium]|nr:hypothetical protein [Gemmatimonadaceae bacterium]